MIAGSSNHGARRGAAAVDMIVLHYTAMADCDAARARLCDPAFEVSAHWLVRRDGTAEALVPEDRRAWHAGASCWGDVADVNSRSIGIELDNDGTSPFPEAQIAALERLLRAAMARHAAVTPSRVLAHSDVAPTRKIDPGPFFPWRRLARAGLSVWPDGEGAPEALPRSLTRIGYDPDAAPGDRLRAFRLRFRPGAVGPADAVDAALAAEIAARWPCAPEPAEAALDPPAARA